MRRAGGGGDALADVWGGRSSVVESVAEFGHLSYSLLRTEPR